MYKTIINNLNNLINNKTDLNEENTKMSLILPFLQVQGFNVFDLNELQSEYVSDMRNNGGEKVDYAILLNNTPVIFIEAKPLGTQLEKYIGQLQRYYTADKGVKYGVLTDGQYYLFFADDERANIMDEKPFYKIDLLCLQDIDLEFLKLFTKESIKDIDNIEQQRGILKLKYFIENSIKRPDKDFIDYISKRVGLKVEEQEVKKLLYVSNKDEEKEVPEIKQIRKISSKKAPDKPKCYTVFEQEFIFESWKEIIITILNIIITKDKKGYENIKEIANTTNMLIGVTKEEVDKGYNKYGIKELANGDFVATNMSSKTTKEMVNKMLSKTELPDNVIKYNY